MNKNNLKGTLILLLTAIIWGLAFVAQTESSKNLPPFTVNALRSFIAAIALFAFYKVTQGRHEKHFFPEDSALKKKYLLSGLLCGAMLAVSVNFQQFGIYFYPENAAAEARSGFITALYVVFVPLISLFFGKKANSAVWISVLIAVAGFYLLCFSGGISGIYLGDILVFVCAIGFALQIISVDKCVGLTGGIKLSVMQFVVTGSVSAVLALIFEQPSLSGILHAAPQIIYLGLISSGVGYTLQIVGQKYAEPAVASLTMSLESVFAALGGWLISGNTLSPREICGCVLVFAAITVAQLPEFFNNERSKAFK